MANDYDAQVKVCAGLLEQFKAELQRTAQSNILRLPKNKANIDAIIAKFNATIGNDDIIDDDYDLNEKTYVTLVADAAKLLGQASIALDNKDFGTFTTRLLQAVSCHTRILVGIATTKKAESANEQSFRYIKALPTIVDDAITEKKSEIGRDNVNTKHDNSGIEDALELIRAEWDFWQENPKTYKNNKMFIVEVMETYKAMHKVTKVVKPVGYSTIEKRIRDWKKQKALK